MANVADINWKYYLGDTFQFWNGPKPPENHPKYAEVMDHLKQIYHSYNIIKEATNHYTAALVGSPFNWYLKGSNGEKVTGEAEELLKNWWDWQKHLQTSQDLNQGKAIAAAVKQMLIRDNGSGMGTSYLRLYEPSRYADLDPFKRIVLHAPKPGSVTVERDDDGVLFKATYQHTKGQETYTLLEDGMTEICAYGKDGKLSSEPYYSDLGGRLPIFEIRGECILGEDTKQGQNSITSIKLSP